MRTATVALVGDHSPHVRSHARIPHLLQALRQYDGLALDAYWVATDEVADTALDGFDGIWLLPGSPYRSESGAILAAQTARERHIPHLATCAGFQHTLLEYARNVCGRAHTQHAESVPDADDLLIVPLACSLVGHAGPVNLTAGSMAERILGVERTIEHYHCAYGLNPGAVEMLHAHGITFTGHDADGEVRIAELPGHPFFLATLFQPELSGDAGRCHPIIRAFADACVAHAASRDRSEIS
jgi:CTP synthase (UTP-ammonia lyase)